MQHQVQEKAEGVEATPSTVGLQPLSNIPETLRTRLRTQIEFYFSPQNLARDTYLRNMLAAYGGAAVPLSVIASFPKVRNLCASELGMVHSNIPADPRLLMNVLDGSQIVAVSPDAVWISPLLPIPPLDPTVKVRPVPSTTGSVPPYAPDMRPPPPQPLNTLVIRDMPVDMKPDKVMEMFTSGEIVPQNAKVDAGNVWYVSFSSEEDAQQILQSNQELNIEGHDIHVSLASVSHQPHMMPNYYAANPMPQMVSMPQQQGMNPGYIYNYPYRPMPPSNGSSGYYMYPNLGHGHPMQYQHMYPGGGIPPYRANVGQQPFFQSGMGRPVGNQVPFYNEKHKMRHSTSNGKEHPEGNTPSRNNKYDKKTMSSNGMEQNIVGQSRGSFKSRDGNSSKGLNRTKSQNEMSDSSGGEKKKNKRKNNSRKRDHDRRNEEVTLNVNDFPALSSGKDDLEKHSSYSSGFSGYASALLRRSNEKRIIEEEEEEKAVERIKELTITDKDPGHSSNSVTEDVSSNPQDTTASKKESIVEGNGHVQNGPIPNQKTSHGSSATSMNTNNAIDTNNASKVSEIEHSNTPPPTWGSKRSFIDVVKKS
jgi:hypothetical protein